MRLADEHLRPREAALELDVSVATTPTRPLVTTRYGHALTDELAAAGERLEAWRTAQAGR